MWSEVEEARFVSIWRLPLFTYKQVFSPVLSNFKFQSFYLQAGHLFLVFVQFSNWPANTCLLLPLIQVLLWNISTINLVHKPCQFLWKQLFGVFWSGWSILLLDQAGAGGVLCGSLHWWSGQLGCTYWQKKGAGPYEKAHLPHRTDTGDCKGGCFNNFTLPTNPPGWE